MLNKKKEKIENLRVSAKKQVAVTTTIHLMNIALHLPRMADTDNKYNIR